jgi:hypothetical protein
MLILHVNTMQILGMVTSDLDDQDKKLSNGFILERAGSPSSRFSNRQPVDDDDMLDADEFVHEKRHVKKKWNKFHHGAQSPYNIAFPALIRSRKSVR